MITVEHYDRGMRHCAGCSQESECRGLYFPTMTFWLCRACWFELQSRLIAAGPWFAKEVVE